MSGPLSNPFMFKSAAGADFYTHQIANSLRLPATSSTAADNSRLTQTFGTVDSNVHFNLNFWIKISAIEGSNPITSARPLNMFTPRSGTSTSTLHEFLFSAVGSYGAGDAFAITNTNTGAYVLSTNNLFRDISAWYNIHIQADLDNGTAGEKLKIFVNGTEADYNVDNRSSFSSFAGIAAGAWTLGDYYGPGYPIQSYLAQWAYVDGTTYAPTDFAETKNGVWIPKDLSSGITWGSAGHLLMFQDSGALGDDTSGEGNDWTSVNLAAHDQMLDSPTFNSSSNGGNFATLGPLWKTDSITFAEGNLAWSGSANERGMMSNWAIPIGTKAYFEYYASAWAGSENDTQILGVNQGHAALIGGDRGGDETAYSYRSNGYKAILTSKSVYGSEVSWGTGNIISCAVDRVNHTINFARNNSWQGTFSISSTMDLYPFIGNGGGTSTAGGYINFGQDGTFAGTKTAGGNADGNGYGNFTYSPPSGFLAMCTGNLPIADAIDPAQTDDNFPQKLFGMLQYSGNNSERTIDTTFQVDKSWARSTVQGQNWYVFDTNRGYFGASSNNYYVRLDVNDEEATATQYNFKAQSGSDITITGGTWFNSGSHTQQMWNWRLNGGTTSTNSTGSLSVTQQVDPSGSFSISTYSGDGGTDTIGHGLSSAPTMVWVKQRNAANNWAVYAKGAGNTKYAYLDGNGAFGTAAMWQNTTPSSSLVYLGDNNEVNAGSRTYVAYCFADCEGYIKSGKYVGNADADGPFIYLGFKPALFVIKHVSSGDDPLVWDSLNGPFNPISKTLSMHDNSAIVDNSNRHVDFLSNGVKIRTSNSNANSNNSDGIVYLAFAKNPFKYATAR